MKTRLRVLRAEKEWTQAQLAEVVGVSRQAIIAIENGSNSRAPSAKM
jgi:putative transcriptional regulator